MIRCPFLGALLLACPLGLFFGPLKLELSFPERIINLGLVVLDIFFDQLFLLGEFTFEESSLLLGKLLCCDGLVILDRLGGRVLLVFCLKLLDHVLQHSNILLLHIDLLGGLHLF